jgi:hypothetical protein
VPWRFRLVLFGIGVAMWTIQIAARFQPDWVERFYARGLYPVVREFCSTLSGWTSYSLAEWICVLLVLVVATRSFFVLRAVVRRRRSVRNLVAHLVSGSLALVGVLTAWGMLAWGFNYGRRPFAVSEALDATGIRTEELRAVCLSLVQQANNLRLEVQEDGDGVMRTEDGDRRALARARRAFTSRNSEYAVLRTGSVSRPKGLVFPLLPWLNISGVFVPFTGEPNVAMELPDAERLFSACHEMAHQLGWAREEEANFVGYAICRRHPDADYRYAATQEALRYALTALQRVDPDAAAAVKLTLGEGLERDWHASRRFWRRYDTRLGAAVWRVNDAYLKAQGQQAGAASYGLMVDLLVADQRRRSRGSARNEPR